MAYTFQQFQEAIDKNHHTRQEFIKHLLTIASGMLAILAAFHTSAAKAECAQIFYLCTLALLSLGILTGGITLYFDTVAAKSVFMQMKAIMRKQLTDSNYVPSPIAYNPPKLFYFCQGCCYITLLLSVVSLAIYSALL